MSDGDDLFLTVESNEDETEFYLVVRSDPARKIDQTEFLLEIEAWLHEVTNSELAKAAPGTNIH